MQTSANLCSYILDINHGENGGVIPPVEQYTLLRVLQNNQNKGLSLVDPRTIGPCTY
jgi:hypothetical protein